MFGDSWSLQVDNQKSFISLLNVSVVFLIKLQISFPGVLGKLKLCCQWHKQFAQDLCTLELHSSGARLMVHTLVLAPCGLLAPAAVRRCEGAEHPLPH